MDSQVANAQLDKSGIDLSRCCHFNEKILKNNKETAKDATKKAWHTSFKINDERTLTTSHETNVSSFASLVNGVSFSFLSMSIFLS